MLIHKLTYFILLLVVLGCGVIDGNEYAEIIKEINELQSIDDKKDYLEQIQKDDQAVRGSEGQDLMLKYGRDSEEYLDFIERRLLQDEINLFKVERYLENHGYPKLGELGEFATMTPWLVIHHAQGYEARERNIKEIYFAYLAGDIDSAAMTMYLGRMYQMKNGERLRMKSPYTAEDEISTLIRELELDGIF